MEASKSSEWLLPSRSFSSSGSSSSSDEGKAGESPRRETAARGRRLAWLVVGLSSMAVTGGLPQVPVLLRFHSPQGFEPGADSPSVRAMAELEKSFGGFAKGMNMPVVMMIRSPQGTVLSGSVKNFTERVAAAVKADERVAPLRPVVVGYFPGADLGGLHVPEVFLQAAFVSKDRRATLLVFVPTRAPTMAVFERDDGSNRTLYAPWLFRKRFMEFLQEFQEVPPEGTEVLLSGNPVLAYERVFDRSLERLTRAEVFVLPLAMLIFVWLVGDLWLLLLPPLVLLVSVSLAAASAAQVARRSPLPPDVPPAMVSVLLACSLDYSLFFLSRFNENRRCGLALERNVFVLLQTTGKTISVSGLLISIAFFGAAAMPEKNLRAAGLVLGLSTLACVLANVLLLPALLLLFSPRLSSLRCCQRRQALTRREYSQESRSSAKSEEGLSPEGLSPAQGAAQQGRAWLLLMRHVERRPILAVAATFALFLPVTAQLPKLRTSADAYAVLPRDLASVLALRELAKQFPVGRFDPYAIVLTATGPANRSTASLGNALLTRPGFASMLQLCDAIKEVGGVDSILGPPMIMTQRVDWPKAQAWHSPKASAAIHKLYQGVLQTHVNGSAVLLQVHTAFLPRGPKGTDWVLRVRRVLDAWQRLHPGCTASLSGAATTAADARATAMAAMPVYLCASTAAIMAVVLALYRSLLLPLRLAFALAFTLAATFGTAVLVYQTPLLHGIWPWLADYDGITFEVVPLAAGVAVALGLDYDIFLVSRVLEFRLQGLTDSASIVRGVANTGGIISGAGTIMALAFSGLFFSEKLMLQQLALLLVTSVLLDTFVVRTVLVPALMLSAKGMNWWPRQMPSALHEQSRPSHLSDSDVDQLSELAVDRD